MDEEVKKEIEEIKKELGEEKKESDSEETSDEKAFEEVLDEEIKKEEDSQDSASEESQKLSETEEIKQDEKEFEKELEDLEKKERELKEEEGKEEKKEDIEIGKKEKAEKEKTKKEEPEEGSKEEVSKKGETEENSSPPKKFSFKKILIILGILFSLLGIALGFYVLFGHLLNPEKLTSRKEEKKLTFKNKELALSQALKSKQKKEKTEFSITRKKEIKEKEGVPKNFPKYYYFYTLRDFFIPLSPDAFLKVEIKLFYDNFSDIVKVKEKSLIFRKNFYVFLRKTSPELWLNETKVSELSKKALLFLKKLKVKPLPAKIEFYGAILKT